MLHFETVNLDTVPVIIKYTGYLLIFVLCGCFREVGSQHGGKLFEARGVSGTAVG